MTYRAPKGTVDILPPASRSWRRVLAIWDDVTDRFGFEQTHLPVLEHPEVFSRGVGEGSEVVEKQMYQFSDRGGRALALRPEGTAGAMRAYLQAGGAGVAKLAYGGPMFRYERPQKGRTRQFYQTGVEYIGTGAPRADVEVIELAHVFLKEVGADVELRLNSIGDAKCRPEYLKVLQAFLEDRRDDLCDDSQRLVATNPLRVLDCKVCSPVLGDAPAATDHLCAECAAHHAEVQALLAEAGIPYVNDPRLVRGLDYYTRTVFEFIGTSIDASQDAVASGGRYDGLAELLGGKPTPGVGVAPGIDRIVQAVKGRVDELPLDAYVVVAGQRQQAAWSLIRSLRGEGLRVDGDPDQRSVKAQFRSAGKVASVAVVVGEEWDEGRLRVRDLEAGEDNEIQIEELAAWLHRR